jgi:hypothetical protein
LNSALSIDFFKGASGGLSGCYGVVVLIVSIVLMGI